MMTATDTKEPTDPTPGQRWQARPGVAKAIKFAVIALPIIGGFVVANVLHRILPLAGSTTSNVARLLAIIALSVSSIHLFDRLARRLLPLTILLQLSLIFPDQAPNRLRAAIRAGSSRSMAKTLEASLNPQLSPDHSDAARRMVELAGALGQHDRRTRGHSERVRLFADLLGQELHLSELDHQKLQWAALLHDVGKLRVPAEILNKRGKPTDQEWAILKRHPEEGMKLAESLRPILGDWVEGVGGHHEKWDGSGYPRGLAGSSIPRAGAIIGLVDAFEVMTAVRSYKRPLSLEDARMELTRCAGSHFSPELVRAFLGISIGDLRRAAGPFALLGQLPYIGSVMHSTPAIAGGAAGAGGTAGVPLATAVAIGAMALPVPQLHNVSVFDLDTSPPVLAYTGEGGEPTDIDDTIGLDVGLARAGGNNVQTPSTSMVPTTDTSTPPEPTEPPAADTSTSIEITEPPSSEPEPPTPPAPPPSVAALPDAPPTTATPEPLISPNRPPPAPSPSAVTRSEMSGQIVIEEGRNRWGADGGRYRPGHGLRFDLEFSHPELVDDVEFRVSDGTSWRHRDNGGQPGSDRDGHRHRRGHGDRRGGSHSWGGGHQHAHHQRGVYTIEAIVYFLDGSEPMRFTARYEID